MSETMNGWKVVWGTKRESVSNWNNDNKFSLTYPVNEEVFPKLEGSKLFFFKEKQKAWAFAATCSKRANVVRCVATNPQQFMYVCNCVDQINLFWCDFFEYGERGESDGNGMDGESYMHSLSPSGTWVADSITCLE